MYGSSNRGHSGEQVKTLMKQCKDFSAKDQGSSWVFLINPEANKTYHVEL